eukprot:628974-Amphidinium_carterae.1
MNHNTTDDTLNFVTVILLCSAHSVFQEELVLCRGMEGPLRFWNRAACNDPAMHAMSPCQTIHRSCERGLLERPNQQNGHESPNRCSDNRVALRTAVDELSDSKLRL